MTIVILGWLGDLSLKQQSVIISALRGPDTHYCPNLKKLTKWLRTITQNNADYRSSYMQQEEFPSIDNIEKELEYTTVHYSIHFLQALEIIGYKHPDSAISKKAGEYYENLVRGVLNLVPETKVDLENRLKDSF